MQMKFGQIGRDGMRKKRERKDYFLGPLHVIVRNHSESSQYGFLTWSINRKHTLDIWFAQTLITIRRNSI